MATSRRAPGGAGRAALDRDLETHRLTSRLRTLGRHGVDLCLGRIVPADGSDPIHIGRLGLTDEDGEVLLVDWRSPAAEAFFGATHADPMGLESRRRYRWTDGRVTDYWDEVFTSSGLESRAALDDQSAFVASLATNRSDRMRDVLGTIQADQDAIIRAGSKGALVVDGGPGTGKTVVALHRTAYLLYSDPRLGHRKGGVLVVGPHLPYLSYVSGVLPSLGEEGVLTCTVRDLVAEGADAPEEVDDTVASLKATAAMVGAIEPAVRLYEEAPRDGLTVETPWADVWVGPEDWAVAFDAPAPGTPHNDGRDEVWDEARRDHRREARRRRGGRTARPPTTRPAPGRRASSRLSGVPGRCSTQATSSETCGPFRPTCSGARPGCPPTRCARSSARTPRRGPSRTSRCWTRRVAGSVTPRPRRAVGVDGPRRRPSASRSPASSTTSSPPTTTARDS